MDKPCTDCKHCYWPPAATGDLAMTEALAACVHPIHEGRVSYVVGPMNGMNAFLMRRDGPCGDAGNLWEPRDGVRQ